MVRIKSRAKKKLKSSKLIDETIFSGNGGETHQSASSQHTTLTSQQGMPIADDQNSLKLGSRGPTALEDMHFREKFSTLITSAFQKESYTHADLVRMAILKIIHL
jgi:hypothetical protein